ncbi:MULTISPECIES: peptidase E [Rossellomorea]|uniref:Type 1 glutamine amidotransferase-like domain-containing protein n=1 Tax=Rossellomorea TaxID=2837508 RepID=UPI001CCCCADD|nr:MULTISPECIES: peptidase E [Rossellomorea]MCA0148013.1 peptidase E [Rossellomorea vietnamensis]UTE75966.1 peptidase E [Rossellomorea sp. KS-H15a]WGG43798.1 peptidase E [Rossellomorea sp. DA94]
MKQIIAMGGGGFSMEPDNLLLDQYIINQSNASRPKVCFLPTASGDAEGYIERFYKAFSSLTSEPSHLSLFKPSTRDLEGFLLEKDIIYVGGGNTKSMLALWKEWGIDVILRKAWESGTILAGLSAGSICWFEEGTTDSYGDGLDTIEGLGLIAGSHSPHYDGEENRRPLYHSFIERGELKPGYAADDGAALHFIDLGLAKAVSSRPNATAYRVEKKDGMIQEFKIATKYLGNPM